MRRRAPRPSGSAVPGSPATPAPPSLRDDGRQRRRARAASQTARAAATRSKFDCFYVYPTVSLETSANSDLRVQPAEQAARGRAGLALLAGLPRVGADVPPADARGAAHRRRRRARRRRSTSPTRACSRGWQDYLAHDNDGRPIVFIGHSQGAAMLIRLLASQVDPNAALRSRLVAAIMLGGNVTVPDGTDGRRQLPQHPRLHLGRAVRLRDRLLVVPRRAAGRQPVRAPRAGREPAVRPDRDAPASQVLCVNPAALGGGSRAARAVLPDRRSRRRARRITTPWVEFPSLYTAACRARGRRDVAPGHGVGVALAIRARASPRPPGPTGASTPPTSTSPSATSSRTSPARRRPTSARTAERPPWPACARRPRPQRSRRSRFPTRIERRIRTEEDRHESDRGRRAALAALAALAAPTRSGATGGAGRDDRLGVVGHGDARRSSAAR